VVKVLAAEGCGGERDKERREVRLAAEMRGEAGFLSILDPILSTSRP
jgi:hypothetical protein